MVTDNDLLNFLIKIEEIQKHFKSISEEGNCHDINTNLAPPNITVTHSWSNYEEGDSTKFEINLETLNVKINEQGSTVYGDYNNDTFKSFNTLSEIYEEYLSKLNN